MKLFIKNIMVAFVLLISGQTSATLITDSSQLTDNFYVTYQDIDFAWASPINIEYWGVNQLHAPDLHVGWDYASPEELQIFKDSFDIMHFTRTDGTYKHAAEFWNTSFTEVQVCSASDNNCYDHNIENLKMLAIRSSWSQPGEFEQFFETIYVRRNSIPEPSTIAIFGLALIAFAIRTKKLSKA